MGLKWNVFPTLLYTAAAYNLNRYNVPLPVPNNPGFFILSGSNTIRGFETSLTGYVTDRWQSVLGYSYTDARVTSATSPTIVAGNRIQLVPFNQFSWWNKYQFTPIWSASVGLIYFSGSICVIGRHGQAPRFLPRRRGTIYARLNETWKLQLTVENVFNQGIAGRPRTATTIFRPGPFGPFA